jgi:TonB family protein
MIVHVVNHLWQSTLCLIVAALALRALGITSGAWRYRVWLAASVKFLVPFQALMLLGGWLSAQRSVPPATFEITAGVKRIAEPVTQAPSAWLTTALLALWAAGTLIVLARWLRRAADTRAALSSNAWEALSPAARTALPPGMRVRYVAHDLEPGIAGVFHPVLLLPEGIRERVSPAELDAIVAHELAHHARRDNLTGALHMLVEAVFWFFPPVWWLGARLVEEREHACDDDVVLAGHDRGTYAEAILKVCESCVAARLACVPGVSGGSLSSRIERIIGGHVMIHLSAAKRTVLAALVAAIAGAPVALGLLTGAIATAQAPSSASDDGEWLPVVKVAPRYPDSALAQALEGEVTLEYTVNERGGTENIEVVESSSSLFEQAALDAVAKYKYAPFDSDGVPIALPKSGVRTVIRFKLDATQEQFLPVVHPAPVYPPRALERGIEGFVIVEYTVTEQGRTADLRVLESASSLLEEAALEAAAKYEYTPRVRNGVAVPVRGVRSVLRFELEQ